MYLLFDIGATNMRLAASDGNLILKSYKLPTPKNYREAMAEFKALAARLSGGKPITAAAGGICGPLDESGGAMTDSFLEDWVGKPVRQAIKSATKSPVFLANDARMAALAEARLGAGKGRRTVAYLTFSSGFGGCRIVDGQTDGASYEPELQVVDINGRLQRIDPLVSGLTIEKRLGVKLRDLKGKKAWAEIEKWMTLAINNTAVYWAPDIIVIGGSVAMNPNVSIRRIQKFLNYNLANTKAPKVAKAKLGDLNGLYGAMVVAKQNRLL